MPNSIFEDLFVLEVANNHWGSIERGLKIIHEFSQIVRFNNIKASLKLQFRDVDTFIHKDFLTCDSIRYIKKTKDTKLTFDQYGILTKAVKDAGCLTMATPFDENSVRLCGELNLDLIKIASSDMNDWPLIEEIAKLKKPVIVSVGGASLKDLDDLVKFFNNRNIPLAINHCVSMYPSEDWQLEINQVDFLKERYPDNVIGFSSHEYTDWRSSIMIAYAKGARTFERHVDIDDGGIAVSPYCSLPHQVDEWFKAFKKAKEMCGASGTQFKNHTRKEIEYLDGLVRGVYAKKDLEKGHIIRHNQITNDVYLAIPLQQGQISCRELMTGEVLLKDIKKDQPIMIDDIDSPYAKNPSLKQFIYQRGLKNC